MFQVKYNMLLAGMCVMLAHAGPSLADERDLFSAHGEPSGEYDDWTKTKKPERPYIHDYSQTLTVSLHINMFDAYEDSPLWKEYLEKDIIAKDSGGHPLKGEVMDAPGATPRIDTQSYQIGYAREWELGLAQKRIDGLVAMLPIQEAGTIHIDAFHSTTPIPHAYPAEFHRDCLFGRPADDGCRFVFSAGAQ